MLLVDNLTTGQFEVYQFPASTPSTSFVTRSTRRFTKQCTFSEGVKVAVCGSDNGVVEVVDVVTGEVLQSLHPNSGQSTCFQLSRHSPCYKEHNLIQTVAANTANNKRYLIAGGSTSMVPHIYIWEKQVSATVLYAMTPYV